MRPEDFPLEGPEDLPVFADFLADLGHPGELTVRRMVKEKRFPSFVRDGWRWYSKYSEVTVVPYEDEEDLPRGTFDKPDWYYFNSVTEAVWAVIERGTYK